MARPPDLVGITGILLPRQSEAVPAGLVLEPWNDVQVEVEHGLPGSLATAVEHVDAVCPEPIAGSSGDLLGESAARCQVAGRDVEQVECVRARDHEGMAEGDRVDVHERNRPVRLGNRGRRDLGGDDPAEDAVGFGTHATDDTSVRIDRMTFRHIDLSHPIVDGMTTYPGLPGPTIGTHLSREAAESLYGPGVTFHVGMIEICTNTGTYLDVPFHRFADGYDLTGLDLARVAAVPALCLDRRNARSITIEPAELRDIAGHAVLVRTDHSRHFGSTHYAQDHPYLTEAAADALVAAGAACVGIDSLNIDDTADMQRPVHTSLLRAGIPIIEHLTNLSDLPSKGFRFTAVPPKIEGAGTFTVRAYATIPSTGA